MRGGFGSPGIRAALPGEAGVCLELHFPGAVALPCPLAAACAAGAGGVPGAAAAVPRLALLAVREP